MNDKAESVALSFAKVLKLLQWPLHILFATGFILLSRWLQHMRAHEFKEQHRNIDRRYCVMAIVFYSFAAAFHLIRILEMTYDAIAGRAPDRQEEDRSKLYASGGNTVFALLCQLGIFLALRCAPDIVLLICYVRWLRGFEANDEARNVSYTIACIAVSALSIFVAAVEGLVSFMGFLIFRQID